VDSFAVRDVTVAQAGFRLTFSETSQQRDTDLSHAASLAAAGLSAVRVRIAWQILAPTSDKTNDRAREELTEYVAALAGLGLDVWPTLCGTRLPGWFLDEGGFSDTKITERSWPRYVDTLAEDIGDIVAGWIPFEAPMALALTWRGDPTGPIDAKFADAFGGIVRSWTQAARLLRGNPLMLALDIQHSGCTSDMRQVWIEAITRGMLAIPGRMWRELDDLQHSATDIALSTNDATILDDSSALHRWSEQTLQHLFWFAETFGPTPLSIAALPDASTETQHEDLIAGVQQLSTEAASGGAPLRHIFLGDAGRVAALREPPSGL
jgi:hypothetical protein